MAFVPFVPLDDDLSAYGEIVSVEYFKALTDNLNYLIDACGVGEITPILVYPGLNDPDPRIWQECNNTPITDALSPLRGYNTPDMISAVGTINSLTFKAKISGTVTIAYIDKIPAVPAVAATRVIDGVHYLAQTAGAAGNSITIRLISDQDFSVNPNVTVTVIGNAITVHLPNLLFPVIPAIIVAQRSDVVTAINASGAAHALVHATLVTSDTNATEVSATALTGGVNTIPAVGSAGSEIVSVVGNNITVRIESGVSTIQQILTKLLASTAAMDLIDAVILPGTPTLTQTAPVHALPLTPGLYLKGASSLALDGFPGGQNTKNLQHDHTGQTQVFSAGNDADSDDDRWSARAHTHPIISDLGITSFEPGHVRIKHYLKIN